MNTALEKVARMVFAKKFKSLDSLEESLDFTLMNSEKEEMSEETLNTIIVTN